MAFLKFDLYDVTLTFLRDVLATNPADPAVLDTHILERQRKLITEESAVNKEINKYLNAPQITEVKGKAELQSLTDKLEELVGEPLSPEQTSLLLAGQLEELRETFKDFEFKGTTVFFWNKELKRPMVGDHQIYGFLKDAAVFWGRRNNFLRKNGTVVSFDKKTDRPFGSIGHTQSVINQDVKCTSQFLTFDRDLERDAHNDSQFLQRPLRAQTAQGPRVTLVKSERIKAGAKLIFQLKVPAHSQCTEDTLHMLFEAGETVGFGQWRGAAHGTFEYEMKKAPAM